MPAPQDHRYQHEAVLYGWKPGTAPTWLMANDGSAVIDGEPDLGAVRERIRASSRLSTPVL